MTHADFVHLRVHSAFSLLEGAIKIGDLVALCRDGAMPAVAVTDTGNLFGALEFSQSARSNGIQPIIGCQMAVSQPSGRVPNGRAARPGEASGGVDGSGDEGIGAGGAAVAGREAEPDQLVLLVQDETGYGNLLKLVSSSFLESDAGSTPRVCLETMEGHSDGLIALTGGPSGGVGRLLREGQDKAAEALLKRLADLFPGRLYVEIMRHGLEEEKAIEDALIDLAYTHDLPLVATNEVFFATSDMYAAHDALLCIAGGRYVSESDRRRLTAEHRFKTASEMRQLFADLPEALDNTLVIARRCAMFSQPRDPMLPSFPCADGQSEEEALRELAEAGLEARLAAHVYEDGMSDEARAKARKPYFERLEYELDVIIEMGFPGYFLIVADFIHWAKEQGIPVGPGRGSGAGSVVAWSLTITDLDPLRFGLLFERFLNPERVSMPDFDIDFCQDRRDEVIRYVQEKYGGDHVAQIITFGTLQARAALRDVGRVLQMPYGQVDRICKMVPNNPANPMPLKEAIETEPGLREARSQDPTVAQMMDFALRLEGLYRHASTHAAGVVIGDRNLSELVPLYRDPRSDMPVTQFSMKYVEMAGLVKFDFLGLKTLTVLARTVEHIAKRGIEVDISTIPLDDRKTFEMLARGESMGVFQLESSGMRDVLKSLKADRFEDIIAVVALYRPGPMDNIPTYIACKHGVEQPDYMDDRLEDILRETFGIMIYQEQVMQIAQVLSGYSLGGADLLRRAMGKKIQSEMDAQRKHFVEGAAARGVPEKKAHQVFDQVNKFAGYGFNKSHAAAYALVAYQTAYLKANYPVEFLAASMTLDLGNTDKLYLFAQEIGRLGLTLLPPDINKSLAVFAVEEMETGGKAVRYALSAIKNVGESAMEEMVKERQSGGPFKDLSDFADRFDPRSVNRRQLENLVYAGGFDCLEPSRARAFEAIEPMIQRAGIAIEARTSSQESLFGENSALSEPDFKIPESDPWTGTAILDHELEALGFYLSAHPLDVYGDYLDGLNVVNGADVGALIGARGNQTLRLAGTVTGIKERTSQRGSRYAFVALSDRGGSFEVTAFSEVLSASREKLEPGSAVLLSVEAKLDGENLRLTIQSVESLEKAAASPDCAYRIALDGETGQDGLVALKRALGALPGGRNKVTLCLNTVTRDAGEKQVEIVLADGYRLSPGNIADLGDLPGVGPIEQM